MKGQKTGGRVAGTPNNITRQLRDTLKTAIAGELDTLAASLASLPVKERLEILIRLMPYCMPKVESIGGDYDTSVISGWDL